MKDLLYLKDEQIKEFIQLLYYAYRETSSDPKIILSKKFFGPAHLRALNLIESNPGINLGELIFKLKVTKQSLNRVLRTLIQDGLVLNEVGVQDKRQRHLSLTVDGSELEQNLSNAQSDRMRAAYRQAGPDAVQGFRSVLEAMMDPELKKHYESFSKGQRL